MRWRSLHARSSPSSVRTAREDDAGEDPGQRPPARRRCRDRARHRCRRQPDRPALPAGEDVTFVTTLDPKGVPTFGYLRASHRKLDVEKSLTYRPYHPHDEVQPLVPGEVVELDVEIWPTSLLIPLTGSR
ncbi:MAG: CocE/NonD family hydrolase C-terminal non-catalytic domain-containing protein [Solirubrobacterales bacterium]